MYARELKFNSRTRMPARQPLKSTTSPDALHCNSHFHTFTFRHPLPNHISHFIHVPISPSRLPQKHDIWDKKENKWTFAFTVRKKIVTLQPKKYKTLLWQENVNHYLC